MSLKLSRAMTSSDTSAFNRSARAFFFSSRRRHTRCLSDWSSDVCCSDLSDCACYCQLGHTAFREGEVAAENAMGHEAIVDNRAVPRPIYTDPEIAGVGLTEAEAREQYGDDVVTGMFPWVANARAVMQNETTGWVKSINDTRYGELLGLVMVS